MNTTWKLDCGCVGTLDPNEVTEPCDKHGWRRGHGFTGNLPPLTMDGPAPRPQESESGQNGSYFVLSGPERAKGFVRPVRRSYKHLKCGVVTTMSHSTAETYARNPGYYGATFCVSCGSHFPIGIDGEFVWSDGSGEKVGT